MYQQQQQMNAQTKLPDQDWAYIVLADLKRVVREYATAATESVCPAVRKLFTDLLNSSLQMQGELFQVMQQNNMYNTSSPALRQEVQKQINSYQQSSQKTQDFIHQALVGQQNIQQQFVQQQAQAQQAQQAHFVQPFHQVPVNNQNQQQVPYFS